MILDLLELRQTTNLAFDVLDEPRNQFVLPFALWAIELVFVMSWRVEMRVE